MKIKQVNNIVSKNILKYKQKLKLNDWHIECDVKENSNEEDKKEDNGHTLAELESCLYEYKTARIVFYADHLQTNKEVLDTLTHELLHIILSPYNFLEDCAGLNIVNDASVNTIFNIKNFCEELVIKHLESLLLGRM